MKNGVTLTRRQLHVLPHEAYVIGKISIKQYSLGFFSTKFEMIFLQLTPKKGQGVIESLQLHYE